MRMHANNGGFSLVELSIVLVILGLLTGGILSGQSLIHAAKLRKTMGVAEQYRVAIFSFSDRYMALPGDMTNASRFWNNATNGNGNGRIETATGSGHALSSPDNGGFDGERAQAFVQLSSAGLIEGGYDGSAVLGKGYPAVPLSPNKGMMLTGPWDNISSGIAYTDPTLISASLYLSMIICRPDRLHQGSSNHNDCNDMFVPEDLWNMDSKADDGLPHRGAVIAYPRAVGECVTDTQDAYNLAQKTHTCGGAFWKIMD